MFNLEEDDCHANLRSTSVPAALWAQLQEIDMQRKQLHADILKLADNEQSHPEMLRMLNALERLAVQWQRMYWDAQAGIAALRSAPLADAINQP